LIALIYSLQYIILYPFLLILSSLMLKYVIRSNHQKLIFFTHLLSCRFALLLSYLHVLSVPIMHRISSYLLHIEHEHLLNRVNFDEYSLLWQLKFRVVWRKILRVQVAVWAKPWEYLAVKAWMGIWVILTLNYKNFTLQKRTS
jgi:hypothetical protein